MRTRVTVDVTGPFFTKDPSKTVRQNARRMLSALADEGASKISQAFAAGDSSRDPISRLAPEHVAEHVVGRVHAKSGKAWALTAVVSVLNAGFTASEGISLMAAAARVERSVHAFRDVTSSIRSYRAVLGADLTQGLE
jgi:hypothetical protein